MKNELFYYIVDNLITIPPTLPPGMKIVVMPLAGIMLPYGSILQFEEGEGPYKSIEQLKEHSEMYKWLLKNNPKRAVQIFRPDFMKPATNAAMYRFNGNKEYEKQLYKILIHSYVGKISNKGISGVHYFNPQRVRITQLLGIDKNGIQIAMIEVRKPDADVWVPKQQVTTLFPPYWSLSYMVAVCEQAFTSKVHVSPTKAKGFTEQGILILFVFDKEGNLKTLYPICDELDA